MAEETQKHSPYRILAGVITGYFMVQLALVPVAAMLPTLTNEFNINVGIIGWIMTIYLLSLTGFQLFAGRIGDQFSHQRVFQAGLILFGISSLFAGLAGSFWQMLICRGLQGIGAALLSGNSMAIVHKVFPVEKRGKAIGWLTSAAAFGSLLGILIGSLFIRFLSWRWVFFIGIPLAIISFMLLRGSDTTKAAVSWKKVDIPGGILLYLSLMFLSLAFGTSHAGHGGSVAESIGSIIQWDYIVLFVICLFLLNIVERNTKNPIIFFEQFRNKVFTSAVLSNFILHFVMICVVFFIPFVVEQGLERSALYSAMVLLSVEFMNAIFPTIGGYFYHKKKWHWLRPFGMGLITSGLFVYYLTVEHAGILGLVLLGGWIGMGMGVYWSINNHLIMTTLDDQHRGFSSGMLETTRQSGHTLSSGISAVAMGMALNLHSDHGAAIKLASLYSGTKSILLIAVVTAAVGFLLTFVRASKTKDMGENNDITA